MLAPSYETLFNFEEIFEAAGVAYIAAASIPALRARSKEEPAELNVAVSFELGPASGSKRIVDRHANGVPVVEYERYDSCVLEIQIVGNRFNDQGSAIEDIGTKLGEVRAKLRVLFRESRWPFRDDNLKYYRVSRLMPAGTQNGQTEKKDADVSTLRYLVDFAIMPDAWPAES